MWTSVIDSLAAPSTSARRPDLRARARGSLSARRRRALVDALTSLANATPPRDPLRRRFQVVLHDRVHAVRSDLLEIALLLTIAGNLDTECAAELDRLLRDGCDSPLYNRDVHLSELRATLHHIRSRLDPPLGP